MHWQVDRTGGQSRHFLISESGSKIAVLRWDGLSVGWYGFIIEAPGHWLSIGAPRPAWQAGRKAVEQALAAYCCEKEAS